MKGSDILKIFAQANRKLAKTLDEKYFSDYADVLDNRAVVEEAQEIADETHRT